MGIITTIILSAPIILIIFWTSMYKIHKASYKFPCQVAIPTGEAPNDVVWKDDKFKIKTKKGHTEVLFYRNKGKVYAPEYKFWSKWLKKGKNIDAKTKQKEEENSEGWAKINDGDLRKHLLRGAHFYKVSDLEYRVVQLDASGNFKVLDHDSVELALDDIERQNEITTSFKDKLIQMGMWLGSLLIIGLLAIMIIVLTMKFAGEQSATILSAAHNAVAASQPVIGG